jgi:hypothetical protein
MLVAERVNDYITCRRPNAVCDPCIAEALGLGQQAHASQITAALGTSSDFIRETARCSICGAIKKVIRRAKRSRGPASGAFAD